MTLQSGVGGVESGAFVATEPLECFLCGSSLSFFGFQLFPFLGFKHLVEELQRLLQVLALLANADQG